MNTRRFGLVVCMVLSLVPTLAGCEDEFLTGSSISRMRLLGMRYTRRSSEPDPAWLALGQGGRFDFSVVFGEPGKDEPVRANPLADVRSMMIHCTKAEIINGQPQCAEVLALALAAQELADAGLPDAGETDAGDTQAQIDATLMALREGIPCGDIADNSRPFWYAQGAIRNTEVTNFPAELQCPYDENDNALRVLSTDVPADYHVNEAGRQLGLAPTPERLIQGVICEYGEPIFKSAPPFFGCRYEIDPNDNLPDRAPIAEVFFYTVGVEHDGLTNNHPKFATNDPIGRVTVTDGVNEPTPLAWPNEPAPTTCDGVTLGGPLDAFVVDYGAKSKISVSVNADREVVDMSSGRKETYQVESFVSYGELDRQFSVVDDLDEVIPDGADGNKSVIELDWDHGTKPVPSKNTLVRFQFLIRDGRGGFVIDERWLCMCPSRNCL